MLFHVFFKQIRPPFLRQAQRFLQLPQVDVFVVSVQKHLRHRHTPPFPWFGELRVFQQSAAHGLFKMGLAVPQDPRNKPGYTVDQHHGRQFPSGEDVVSDGDLLHVPVIQHPLVHAFIVAAEDHQVFSLRQFQDLLMGQNLSPGRHVQDLPALCADILQAGGNGFREHHHPGAAAKGCFVCLIMFIRGVVPDVVDPHVQQTGLVGPAQNAVRHHRPEHFREYRQYVDPHPSNIPSINSTVITPPGMSTFLMNCFTAGIIKTPPSSFCTS